MYVVCLKYVGFPFQRNIIPVDTQFPLIQESINKKLADSQPTEFHWQVNAEVQIIGN